MDEDFPASEGTWVQTECDTSSCGAVRKQTLLLAPDVWRYVIKKFRKVLISTDWSIFYAISIKDQDISRLS